LGRLRTAALVFYRIKKRYTVDLQLCNNTLGKCVPKGVLTRHHRQEHVIGLLDRHYPSPIEVHTDRERDGMSLGRNS
jgi:hypothetical protein